MERKGCSETFGSKGFVHGVDLGLVDLLANVALEFESGRDDVVLHTEGLRGNINILRLLETVQLLFLAEFVDFCKNLCLVGFVLLSDNFSWLLAVCSSPLLELVRLRHDDGDATVLERVAVDHALSDVRRLNEDVFDFLGSHVLALRQFENVLASVQNLDRAIIIDNSNITRLEIAILVNGCCCQIWAHEVAASDTGATDADFATRERFVSYPVIHIWQILQTDGTVLHRSTDSTRYGILWFGDGDGATSLGKTVGFEDGTAESNLDKLEHILADRSRGCHHDSDFATELFRNFSEDERVVAAACVRSSWFVVQVVVLRGEAFVEEPALAARGSFELGLDLTVDLVVESRHRWEKCWLENLTIFDQLEWATLIVTLRSTANHNCDKHELIEDVRSGQVVDSGVLLSKALVFVEKQSRAKDTPVTHLDTLRVSSRA